MRCIIRLRSSTRSARVRTRSRTASSCSLGTRIAVSMPGPVRQRQAHAVPAVFSEQRIRSDGQCASAGQGPFDGDKSVLGRGDKQQRGEGRWVIRNRISPWAVVTYPALTSLVA